MFVKSQELQYDKFPNFICTKCNHGILRIIEDSIIHKYPAWLNNMPENGEIYYDKEGDEHMGYSKFDVLDDKKDKYITILFLKCDNKKCNEVYSSCGMSKYIERIEVDEEKEIYYESDFCFIPKFFYPNIRLFKIPLKTPDKVVKELDKAFSLFWSDFSSCGNSLRKAIERMIDDIDLSSAGKKIHYRIESLDEKYAKIKDKFLAIKWIGNDGSHKSDLTLNDILLAFELLEICVESLYEDEKNYDNVVKQINDSRMPISKIKNKK